VSGSQDPGTTQGTVRQPTVAEVAREPMTTVETRAHLAAAAYLIKRSQDGALVVVTDDARRRALGVVTDADISQAVADGHDLERRRISDVLAGRDLVTVHPDTPVDVALRQMIGARVRHLVVVGDGGSDRIVDMTDLCRVLVGPA
jgi:CBS domain-containing protein